MVADTEVNLIQTLATIANLGAATAVIVVVILFLRYNKERDEQWRQFFVQLNQGYCDDIKGLTSTMAQVAELVKTMVAFDTKSNERIVTMIQEILKDLEEHENRVNKRIRNLMKLVANPKGFPLLGLEDELDSTEET